ncbi:hypothetical protein Tsubulata_004510 [Turnera subulata]|uniref:Pentacotripeptide-repeat region of PRORP domain-containing protein n=1 Tax=Turnera subulata TaxID=218843 RepID=A0A9Q0GGZ9_9ROSI|nr:hypothetical protein Tsubulata_004510 [Turnera subulata]
MNRAIPICYKSFESTKHCKTIALTPCLFGRRFFSAQPTPYPSSPPLPPEFNSYTYSALLQHCIHTGNHHKGRSLHCHVLKTGYCLDLFAQDVLLNFYVRLGGGEGEALSDATKLFDGMPQRSVVSFVTLMQGFSESSMFSEAVGLFFRLHKDGHGLTAFALSAVLKLVVRMELPGWGRCVHACVCKLGLEGNEVVGTALLDAYSVFGDVGCARRVFDSIAVKDIVSWSRMVACYAENDGFDDSMRLFSEMRMLGFEPNYYNVVSVIKACVGLEAFGVGRGVHGFALKMGYEVDLYVGVELLELYTAFECFDDAVGVFEGMPKDDVISWTFMIGRYAQSNQGTEAVNLFCRMRQNLVLPNQFTFSSVLCACADLRDGANPASDVDLPLELSRCANHGA